MVTIMTDDWPYIQLTDKPNQKRWIIDMEPKKQLKEALEDEDEKDQRLLLFGVMLLLAACNTAVMTLAPAYVLQRRLIDYYPFLSRAEVLLWMIPILILSIFVGTAVFVVTLILYVKFHNVINGRIDTYGQMVNSEYK